MAPPLISMPTPLRALLVLQTCFLVSRTQLAATPWDVGSITLVWLPRTWQEDQLEEPMEMMSASKNIAVTFLLPLRLAASSQL